MPLGRSKSPNSMTQVLALVLAVIHAGAGLVILLLSSWFIAASAVAGFSGATGFNYMLPAVAIRAFALLRISSGYAEMWFGHKHLLRKLANIRLTLFQRYFHSARPNSPIADEQAICETRNLRGIETDKLTYQSEAMAAIWVGWVNQHAGVFVSLLLVTGVTLYFIPVFSALWFAFLAGALVIYSVLLLSSFRSAKLLFKARTALEIDVEHTINASAIWHMYQCPPEINAKDFYHAKRQLKRSQEWANSAFLLIVFIAISASILLINTTQSFTPMALVLPMALFAAPDWFGRVFQNQARLLEYIDAKNTLQLERSAQIPRHVNSKKTLSNCGSSKSLAESTSGFHHESEINSLHLCNLSVNGAQRNISASLNRGDTLLLKGSSGSGKSRILMAISGLIPYHGDIQINHDVLTGSKVLATSPSNDIVYSEQHPYVLSATLRDNLLIAAPEPKRVSDATLLAVLADLNLKALATSAEELDQWLGDKGRSLSGGEKKRLGIARLLLSDARVLLLDEPFEGLDDGNIQNICNIVNKLQENKDKIVILASHIFPKSLRYNAEINLDMKTSNMRKVNQQRQT